MSRDVHFLYQVLVLSPFRFDKSPHRFDKTEAESSNRDERFSALGLKSTGAPVFSFVKICKI